MSRKFQKKLKVLEYVRINELHYLLKMDTGGANAVFEPGQFVEVLVPGAKDAFLRRPISLHDVADDNSSFTMMIKIVGEGTRALSEVREGDELDIVFPLGHGFSINENHKKVLLVGGGCGVAPLLHLSKVAKEKGLQPYVLIGGKTANDILEADAYRKYAEVAIMTENAELGEKGMVTDHIWLKDGLKDFDFVYTCGPDPMMKAIAALAEEAGIGCEVSLENLMACGIGACLCCTVHTHEGNVRACVEGPVFNANQIIGWNQNENCHV
ncbi:MAG: dihydroorotate dehydrogenase electron transfer subunit [Bacteroidales bacterium]|nr:dihydroorotate dehydrogenase electron transfer subunit [Bacteroidales bacterium]